jgi:putative ABC transport system permease protein
MNGARFALALAWRETRGSRRTLLLLVGAVAVGVAALVAIRSFAASVRASIGTQARAALGADLVAGGARVFTPQAEAELAALVQAAGGARVARVTSFGAMTYAEGMALEPGYPFYGEVKTEPPGAWERPSAPGEALADEALLIALDARVGDTLALGEARFRIRAAVRNFPGDIGVRTSFGPRLFIPFTSAPATGLLGFGSRARYEAFVRLPETADAQRLVDRHRPRLAAERLSLRTVADDQRRLSENLGRIGRYLGLVGLIALLLGGIGVASAVHVLVRRRMQTIAVLRCLGASSRQATAVYLAQALGLGLLGSALGAALGSAVQALLPRLLRNWVPADLAVSVSWPAVASGLLTGACAAALFALPPLLAVRRVPPLLALRKDVEPLASPSRRERRVSALALGAGVLLLAGVEARSLLTGAAFAAGLALALGALWLSAYALRALLRRSLSPRLPYAWRQGLANLHRPGNQTLAVALALGFGAFLLGTLLVLQHNLQRELRAPEGPRTNLAFFDIQPDQLGPLLELVRAAGCDPGEPVPIVPMRIHSLKGVPAAQKLAQAAAGVRQGTPAWLMRREFRSSYRAEQRGSEELVAGSWWTGAKGDGATPVSLEVDVARDLEVGVGDEIVWDVQGVLIESRVASLRRVEWRRMEPAFFAVFPRGPLDAAPQTFVTMLRVDDAAARARLIRALAGRFPNVSALDLAEIQRTLEGLFSQLDWAVRFLALFSVVTGGFVLAGAVAASRLERLREAVLLKALGATRRQVLRVVVAEYAALGALAALCGALLATAAGWALLRFLFEARFTGPGLPLLGFAAGVVLLTVALGASGSLDVFRRTSLELLRNE